MPTFEHMRVSLSPLAAGDLPLPAPSPPLSRADYLRRAFEDRRKFIHKGKPFAFQPTPSTESGFVAGFFSREAPLHGRDGPDHGYVEKVVENWELAFIVQNVEVGDQRAAAEYNHRVGSPLPIVESFMKSLPPSEGFHGYTVYVLPLVSEDDYWDVVKQNTGRITEADFTLIPPNAFEAKKELAILIQAVNVRSNSEESRHAFLNKDGNLDVRAEQLAGMAEVAMEGAGGATLKAGKKVIYSSKSQKTKTSIEPNEIPKPDNLFALVHLVGRLFSAIRRG